MESQTRLWLTAVAITIVLSGISFGLVQLRTGVTGFAILESSENTTMLGVFLLISVLVGILYLMTVFYRQIHKY